MSSDFELVRQGAEARLYAGEIYGKPCLVKERFAKKYRHEDLDKELTWERMKNEIRALARCRVIGVHAPLVYYVDYKLNCIYMEHFSTAITAKAFLVETMQDKETNKSVISDLSRLIGQNIGQLHMHNIIHGDLTTSNILITDRNPMKLSMIDFGLSYVNATPEDKGVDLYVLERALLSSHPQSEFIFAAILQGYTQSNRAEATEVLKKFEEVRQRGRKRLMLG